MAEFKVRTRSKADPHGKPRVYFCAHPADFTLYYDRICEDIFKTHDCAIYCTHDMSEPLDEVNIEVDLGKMNLFLVPVTARLMREGCRAMAVDIAFAKKNNIPILPFMMETGIDAIYSRPENFGERHYLNPISTDSTEISYYDKLKKYLDAILISDKMAKRVRAAFDAYIFLSYRKKDRRYASELMRIMHNIPGCQDVAIWYDEFLTPGESFITNIERAMKHSKLFTLLVTPNLLEDGNFVMAEEYPAAKRERMSILPAEMEKTDRHILCEKYEEIPECVNPCDKEFMDIMLGAVSKIATSENDADPEHNFLIGLAYLDGIDVEIDVARAIALITSAAEASLPEAMEKLYNMYFSGDRVEFNYTLALKWAERLGDFYTERYGEGDTRPLLWRHNVGYIYYSFGRLAEALKVQEEVYELKVRYLGKEHPDTLIALNNLAFTYGAMGDPEKQYDIEDELYETSCQVLGEEHPSTILYLSNLAVSIMQLGDYKTACEIQKYIYLFRLHNYGDRHVETIEAMSLLAMMHRKLGERTKAAELEEKAYNMLSEIYGKENLRAQAALSNLALIHYELGQYESSSKMQTTVYQTRKNVLGEEHPDTLLAANNLSLSYTELGKLKEAKDLLINASAIQEKSAGIENALTLMMLNNLSNVHRLMGSGDEAMRIQERVCLVHAKIFGEDHPDTMRYRGNLALIYGLKKQYKKQCEIEEKIYEQRRVALGDEHPDTVLAMTNLATTYYNRKQYGRGIELMEKVYEIQRGNSEENAVNAKASRRMLLGMYFSGLKWSKALRLMKDMSDDKTAKQ